MPLVLNPVDGSFVLRCVNNHGPASAGSMEAMPGYSALVLAHPSRPHAMPGKPRVPARIDATGGLPMRAYVCNVCGYVELYLAAVVAPEEWPIG
jgi:hypothetical protein